MSHTMTIQIAAWEHTTKMLADSQNRTRALEAAIRLHRHNVWGNGEVGHPEDEQLYAALEA